MASEKLTALCARCGIPFQVGRTKRFCGKSCWSPGLAARFWPKVDKRGPDECWPWRASLKSNGRGQIGINQKPVGAHRVAWELTFGPIPEGMDIMHSCDNPPCCNPAHLSPGTHQENMADMAKKNRGTSKLNDDDVLLIRRAGSLKAAVALMGGKACQSTIHYALSGHTWKHLPMV